MTARKPPSVLTAAEWRRMFPEVAEVQRKWESFVAERLRPLGITEGQVFEIIGRGLLGDRRLSSGKTQGMIEFQITADELGIKIHDRRRIPPKTYFDDTSKWPWRIDRTPAFGDCLVMLYDLLAEQIPPQHVSWDGEKNDPVPTAFNKRAAQLTADTANVLGCADPERPLLARDILSRLHQRGRRSSRKSRKPL